MQEYAVSGYCILPEGFSEEDFIAEFRQMMQTKGWTFRGSLGQDPDEPVITRVEVVDHYSNRGRVFTHWAAGSSAKIALQDEGRTLKVFIGKQSG